MRRHDKIKNIQKANLIIENLYLTNKNPSLNESIDNGSFILYHRTNKNPLDFNKGFKSSQYGGKYGTGLYTFYDLDSATNEFNAEKYGKYLLEISVQNNGKFLILDPDLLKKVYGSDISLIEQLKKIFGGKFNKFYQQNKKNIDEILGVSDKMGEESYEGSGSTNSTDILGELAFRCKGFFEECDGAAVLDNLGKVFVLYETNLINPIRYSEDNGKTWISIKNKSSYNIGKDNRSGEDKLSNQKFSGIKI
jgi:hypothetical protein